MKDSVYRAKIWLMRVDEIEKQLKKQILKVTIIESKLNHCIINYEKTGARDPINAREAHEDLLADYVTAKQELEDLTRESIKEDMKTRKKLEQLNNPLYIAILTDRFVNKRSIKEIAKSGDYRCSEAQLYNLQKQALEEFSSIPDILI